MDAKKRVRTLTLSVWNSGHLLAVLQYPHHHGRRYSAMAQFGPHLGKPFHDLDTVLREILAATSTLANLWQQNPMAPGGVGVLMWGCDYLVGKAKITITVTTNPGEPIPCKRTVAFE